MTLMSRKVDYALLILNYLDQKDEGAAAREIADHFHLSKGFVANILKELCSKDFVASHRGVKGGYVLAKDLEETSLAELMEALDANVYLAECNKHPEDDVDVCSLTGSCPVKGPIVEVHRRIVDLLKTVTLADLFRSQKTEVGTQYGIELGSAKEMVSP